MKSNEVHTSVEGHPDPTLKEKEGEAKQILTQEVSTIWHTHVKEIVVQGKFLDLLSLKSNCMIWKSIMYNLPVKLLKFLVNAISNTLKHKGKFTEMGQICNKQMQVLRLC